MPSPLVIKSPLLKPLGALASVQKGGAAYYRELKNSPDRYIAAGAWCTMLESKLMTYSLEAEVMAYCGHAAVRARAFTYFEAVYEHGLARQVAETPAKPTTDFEQAAMLAELAQDNAAGAASRGRDVPRDGRSHAFARRVGKGRTRRRLAPVARMGVAWGRDRAAQSGTGAASFHGAGEFGAAGSAGGGGGDFAGPQSAFAGDADLPRRERR